MSVSIPGVTQSERATGPHLVVSAHFVYAGTVGGAEPMLYNLLGGLSQECASLTVLCGNKRNLDPLAARDLEHGGVRILECGGNGKRFIAEQRACLSSKVSGDVTLFPNYFVPPITPGRLGRVACVLHDMQFRHFPQYFTRRKRAWLAAAVGLAMHKADRIIVDSDFVRRDVLRIYGRVVARKIRVIPIPISWQRFEGKPTDRSLPMDRPYVLSVAAQYPHKNLDVLIRGFAQLANRDKDVMLVLCGQDYANLRGGGGEWVDPRKLVENLGLTKRVRMTGYIDDASLGRWYRGATAFAFPSLFEGFGMPPVEALGFGLPTLTTRCTALPETTLGLATYVDDATDTEEWAARLGDMVRDPGAYQPVQADVAQLRAHYDPARISRSYISACAE